MKYIFCIFGRHTWKETKRPETKLKKRKCINCGKTEYEYYYSTQNLNKCWV